MESLKVDPTAELPYRVPVDVMSRFFQLLILAAGAWTLYTCVQAPKDASLVSWGLGLFLLLYGAYLQFHPSGLYLDESGINHGSMYFKKRNILWTDIDQVVSGTQDLTFEGLIPIEGSLGKINPAMGPYLMILTRKDGGQPFLLNFKPYSVKGLATMVSFLRTKATGAKIDERTLKMMEGIFPSVFFGEQKGHG